MHFFFMIHCYSLFSFKTPLLVSFSVEVKREKTLTGCFSINRFFFLHCNSMTIKKLMNEKYIFDAACKTTLKKGPWNWHMPLSWTDCHFFYTQPLKKNLTLTTLNDHAWFSFSENSQENSWHHSITWKMIQEIIISLFLMQESNTPFSKGCYLRIC